MGELALTEEIKTLGLEKYAEELERDGLTIVPRRSTASVWTGSMKSWN